MLETALLLHNIRSAHNVGSIFRTADAAGISKIVLTGYTPLPVDRFGRPQKEIAKTALGAEVSIPWEYSKRPVSVISRFKKEWWTVAGIEQDARARNYRSFTASGKTMFILGNEVRGLSKELCDRCDVLLEIPMHGKKESLNVAVAAGIVLFAVAARQ